MLALSTACAATESAVTTNTSAATPTRPCRWCGAYGNSAQSFVCTPGRLPRLGRSRLAARDSRNSAAIRAHIDADRELFGSLTA
jgi:hypothetical protein